MGLSQRVAGKTDKKMLVKKSGASSSRSRLSVKHKSAKLVELHKKTAQVVIFPLERVKKALPKGLNEEQRQQLVLDNRLTARKMARSMLRKWRSRLDLTELESTVDLSLCEAANRFDPSRGVNFVTFLFYYLRGNLVRQITDAASASMTVSINDGENSEFNSDNGRASNQLLDAVEAAAALNSQEQVLPDEEFYRKELHELSKQACDQLDQLEQQVLYRVFRYEDNIQQLAKNLGYSRCHLSRVKKKALESLTRELSPVINDLKVQKTYKLSAKKRAVTRRGEHRRQIIEKIYSVGA